MNKKTQENMIKGLAALLLEAATVMDCPTGEDTARFLIEKGVLLPPIPIGSTVFAAIQAEWNGGEFEVYPWKVRGVVFNADRDEWLLLNEDDETFEIGDELCKLTEEEARACERILS